jgi:hypothetical protein
MGSPHKAVLTGPEILQLLRRNYRGVLDVILCAPFVTTDGLLPILKILGKRSKTNLTLITRWEPLDLLLRYSHVEAFEALFKRDEFEKWNVKVYVVDELHAKAVVLGHRVGVLGSANITAGGLERNEELAAVLHGTPLEQLRRQLDVLVERGTPFTEEDFRYKRSKELPRYAARAKKIRALMNAVRTDRDPGLQSFTQRDETQDPQYFTDRVEFLGYLKARGRVAERQALTWLHAKAVRGGVKINLARLALLERTGLMGRAHDGLYVKPAGRDLSGDSNSRAFFYSRLRGAYREFERLEQHSARAPIAPRALVTKAEVGAEAYWKLRLRWLVALGLADRLRHGREFRYDLRKLRQWRRSNGEP